ncbi:MAG: helix-turn-helix transcriptional regulator [Burkholderiales bacterium]|nr:helix-turn-helix transcriptional regulator [Burkholderiales bacterium]
MRQDTRSTCPISTGLEIVGDRWTLLVIRDMMFAGKRHFREFLQSEEGISSNVLADRLAMLVERGLVTRAGDPAHAQKAIYSLTEPGIALLPVIASLSRWAQVHFPATRRPEARVFLDGDEAAIAALQQALRREHLASGGR